MMVDSHSTWQAFESDSFRALAGQDFRKGKMGRCSGPRPIVPQSRDPKFVP